MRHCLSSSFSAFDRGFAAQAALDVPMAQQTLVFKLRELPDAQTLATAGVEDHAIVHLRCPVLRTFRFATA